MGNIDIVWCREPGDSQPRVEVYPSVEAALFD